MFPSAFARPLLSASLIQNRVSQLGAQITQDYAQRDLLLVGVLKGAQMFVADLARAIRLPVRMDFLVVSHYGQGTEPGGNVRILADLSQDIRGLDVLLVEDIVDSGYTLTYLTRVLLARQPASLRTCVLLDKVERRKVPVELDYVGFTIPDRFVVGYGLDYRERYRNLPHIAVLHTEGTSPA